jgi:hypothetical protein
MRLVSNVNYLPATFSDVLAVQPVIQKETIQPTTVHHTTAIHEKIHDAPIVHEATTLPTISHEDFLKQQKATGPHSHSDSNHSHQHYEGAPRVGGAGQDGTRDNTNHV